MARRRKKKQPSGHEVGFIFVAFIAYLFLTEKAGNFIEPVLMGLSFVLIIGVLIWFVKAFFKDHDRISFDQDNRADTTINKSGCHPGKANLETPNVWPLTNRPLNWSLELIAKMDWRVFEKVCMALWQAKGYSAEESQSGADGGVDFYLIAASTRQRIGIVQCKNWKGKQLGVKVVRELQGVLIAEQLQIAVLMFSGKISKDALKFINKEGVSVKLQNAQTILDGINKLPRDTQKNLFDRLIKDDFEVPSCPNCDIKLVKRQTKETRRGFWGCQNFPRCRYTLN